MKKYLEPSDLGLEESFAKRGDVAVWESTESGYWKCSNCENLIVANPSYYCEDCGSLMVNALIAKKKYRESMDEFIKKQTEEEANDVSRN